MRDVERAAALMESSPEEALAIISAVDASLMRGERDGAYYALIYCEALYYNYIECDDEALARPMVEYYMECDDHALRARALYQYALIAYTGGEDAEAMIMLLEAQKSLKEASDIKLEGLVHRTMADIYGEGCLFANALDSYAKAKACFDALGLGYHSASALYDMGGTLIQLRNFEEAHTTLHEALDYAIAAENREFTCAVLHELLDLSIYCNDYDACNALLALFDELDVDEQ